MKQAAKKASFTVGSKKTSIGFGNVKKSSMNKSKKRGFKKYRGQGR